MLSPSAVTLNKTLVSVDSPDSGNARSPHRDWPPSRRSDRRSGGPRNPAPARTRKGATSWADHARLAVLTTLESRRTITSTGRSARHIVGSGGSHGRDRATSERSGNERHG